MSVESPRGGDGSFQEGVQDSVMNGSPPHMNLWGEESEAGDPVDPSEESVCMVRSSDLSYVKCIESKYVIISRSLQKH